MIKIKNKAYLCCPIPGYDISGMEQWLEKQAREGYILRKDGIWGSFAAFDISKPQELHYRLDAAPYGTGMFSRDGGEPDPEQIELSRDMGWEYIAKLRDFFIYVSPADNDREFHTDPQVRAMALKAVRNRCIDTFVSQLLWLLFIAYGVWRCGFFSLVLSMQTWVAAVFLLVVMLNILGAGLRMGRLIKIRKSIMAKGFAEPFTNINSKGNIRLMNDIFQIILALTLICVGLDAAGKDLMNEEGVPIEEYNGTVPFATMIDFVPDGEISRADYFDFGNTVEVWQDPLSPVNIVWDEIAEVKGSDGSIIDGGLDIRYHETASAFIAERLAREAHRSAAREKNYRELNIELPGLDYCAAFSDRLHFPTVIMQKGNICICARLYQTGSSPIALEEWAEIIYKSLFVS